MKNKLALSVSAMLFGLVLAPAVALANPVDGGADENAPAQGKDVFGVGYVEGEAGKGEGIALGNTDLRTTAARIINVALGLLGIIAVVIVLIGGFEWMTAGGSEEKVGEARKRIFAGIIGIAIILSAWAITRFVLDNLKTATNVDENAAADGVQ